VLLPALQPIREWAVAAGEWISDHRDEIWMVVAQVASRGTSGGGGGRLASHPSAAGPHSTFRTNGTTGRVNHYETYRPQTNPRNPNP
jgi:hypothetical protein